jgi:hypothetical protein
VIASAAQRRAGLSSAAPPAAAPPAAVMPTALRSGPAMSASIPLVALITTTDHARDRAAPRRQHWHHFNTDGDPDGIVPRVDIEEGTRAKTLVPSSFAPNGHFPQSVAKLVYASSRQESQECRRTFSRICRQGRVSPNQRRRFRPGAASLRVTRSSMPNGAPASGGRD